MSLPDDELHGWPHKVIGCARCHLGVLAPEGGGFWRCRFCGWVGRLRRRGATLEQS